MKILYIHGLESGVHGHKVTALRKHFGDNNVVLEEMELSMTGLSKRNGILRRLLTIAGPTLGLGGASILLLAYDKGWFASFVAFLVLIGYLFISRKKFVSAALRKSFYSCVEIQRNAIRIHQPDIIIASSFGGAVALELLRTSVFSGPCIALCPAFQLIHYMMGVRVVPDITSRLLIIHGSSDKVVPHSHSVKLENNNKNTTLTTVEGGTHGLGQYIIDGSFIKTVEDFISQQQSKL